MPTNPLAPPPSYAGSFRGERLVVNLEEDGAGYRGTITLATQRFPLRATVDGAELRGTFESQGTAFPFIATITGATLTLASGGAFYTMTRELPPEPPRNPLAAAVTPTVEVDRLAVNAAAAAIPSTAPVGPLYRHPTGVTFHVPLGWRTEDAPLGVQLVPPDLAAGAELYLVTGQPAQGLAGVEDPRLAVFLDQAVQQIGPSLRRSGAPQPAGRGGLRLRYVGRNPIFGAEAVATVLVRLERGHAIAFLGAAESARLAARMPQLEAAFASLAWGEGERDAQLVGLWHHWEFRGKGPVGRETRQQVLLVADGRIAMSSQTETVGVIKGHSHGSNDLLATFAGQGGSQRQGSWTASQGRLFITWSDGAGTTYQYQVQGFPGQRRVALVGSDGTRTEWTEQPASV
jgi:hypothetical protein